VRLTWAGRLGNRSLGARRRAEIGASCRKSAPNRGALRLRDRQFVNVRRSWFSELTLFYDNRLHDFGAFTGVAERLGCSSSARTDANGDASWKRGGLLLGSDR